MIEYSHNTISPHQLMIDKILNTFSSYLGEVIPAPESSTTVTSTVPNPHLPEPVSYLDIASVQVPLYGYILAGEMRLLERFLELQAAVYAGLNIVIKSIGADEYTSIPEIKRALKVGGYQTYKTTIAKVSWSKIGQPELAKIAEKQGVTGYFTATVTPDGDKSVQEVVEQYFDTWRELGFRQESGLALANAVLNKQSPITREQADFVTFESEDVLKQAGLSWGEIDLLEDLINEDAPYLLIIKFRLGIGQYNLFDYVPYALRPAIVEAFKKELSSGASPNPTVAANANIEIDTSAAGGAEAPLA